MNSALYFGDTWHRRNFPEIVQFRYPLFWVCLDLHALSKFSRPGLLFSIDRWASFFSIRTSDHLVGQASDLLTKVRDYLSAIGFSGNAHHVCLITTPRLLGYVFNPASFFLCLNSSQEIELLICEVRNTFGERHLYPVKPSKDRGPAGATKFEAFSKDFYVSPFIESSGDYFISIDRQKGRFQIDINLVQGEKLLLETSAVVFSSPLTRLNLMYALVRYPFCVWLTMSRIIWQALRLYSKKRVPLYSFKPSQRNETVVSSQGNIFVRARLMLLKFAQKFRFKLQKSRS